MGGSPIFQEEGRLIRLLCSEGSVGFRVPKVCVSGNVWRGEMDYSNGEDYALKEVVRHSWKNLTTTHSLHVLQFILCDYQEV
jgi:hypothetical protein